VAQAVPHLPQQAAIEAYGQGGFRFGGMSHRGSLLSLPSGMYAWAARAPEDLEAGGLDPVFAEADAIDVLVVGAGASPLLLPQAMRARLRELHIGVEQGSTAMAVRTYNVLIDERRRVAAALLAVD
jgi:uncharacterized protein